MTLARRKAATFPEVSRDSRWLTGEELGGFWGGKGWRESTGERRGSEAEDFLTESMK